MKAERCEGFQRDDYNDHVQAWEKDDEDITVETFISSRKLDARWDSQDDFISLLTTCRVRETYKSLQERNLSDLSGMFVQALSKIFYDFDSLPVARSRPFRKWERAWSAIVNYTTIITDETRRLISSKEFLAATPEEGVHMYKDMLTRRSII